MSAEIINQAAPPPTAESKTARKKKAKTNSAAPNGTDNPLPISPTAIQKEDSSLDAKNDLDPSDPSSTEHPYIKELTKQIRNVHKKLTGLHKLDAIVTENPGLSLEDLVKERKINADQKTSMLKKPLLEAQLAGLEEQLSHYKRFDAEYQVQFQQQRDELTAAHVKEVEGARETTRIAGVNSAESQLRDKLLIFSRFLRCAAAKRTVEEEQDTEESKAFEGALLLVYGGDEKAVGAAMKLIDGVEERIPSIEGNLLSITCKC